MNQTQNNNLANNSTAHDYMVKLQPQAVTFTVIFEAPLLNRDEKASGNVHTIKKLTRFNNYIYSYISKQSLRHKLFRTLSELFPTDWVPADTGVPPGNNKTEGKSVQLKLDNQNILTHAELDAFGYMYTPGNKSITRKGTVGLTKCISLEPWDTNTQLKTAHDFCKRSNSEPIIVTLEEHLSLLKASFTIDLKRLGVDDWIVSGDSKNKPYVYDAQNKTLEITLSGGDEDSDSESQNQQDPTGKAKDKAKNDSKKTKQKKSSCVHKINGVELIESREDTAQGIKIQRSIFSYKRDNIELGKIIISKSENERNFKVIFILDREIKRKRILQIMDAIKNGLIYHVSGENPGLSPKFIISTLLAIPMPIFDSSLSLEGLSPSVLNNYYIIRDFELNASTPPTRTSERENKDRVIYVFDDLKLSQSFVIPEGVILIQDWNQYKEHINKAIDLVYNGTLREVTGGTL